ncbi:hypothetical protein KQI63_03355 [bacterium]|nr:hypothetical protein [bacterium]
MKRTTLSAALLLVAFALPATLHAEGFAGSAGAFLRMGSGASALASGDAGVARAMGAEQAHYNAAGLPFAPANDVYVGYHSLSLDRSLAHISALVQIPEIAFWTAPMRPITTRVPNNPDQPAELVYPEQLRRASLVEYRVTDYLNDLADAILHEAWSPTPFPEAGSEDGTSPRIVTIEGIEYVAGVLNPIIEEALPEVISGDLRSQEQVIALLASKYQTVQKKPAAIAVSWTHAGTDNIQSRDTDGRIIGDLGYYENRFALSFGLKLHRTVSAGVTVGVLYALIPDLLEDGSKPLTSTTFGGDIGLQFRPWYQREAPFRLETLAFGAAAYDIGGKNSWNTTGYWSLGTTKTDKYPNRYRAGFSYEPLAGVSTYLDLETDGAELLRPKGGVEFRLWGLSRTTRPGPWDHPSVMMEGSGGVTSLTLRAGVDRDRPTFGFGLMLPVAGLGATRLDYAYVLEPVSPEATQVLSWRFRFTL